MKVCELEGAELDYWVAKAEGHPLSCDWDQGEYILIGTGEGDLQRFEPSTEWAEGGPIIDCLPRLRIQKNADGYAAQIFKDENFLIPTYGYGNTILVAAMRAYVASKFGEEVSHPKDK